MSVTFGTSKKTVPGASYKIIQDVTLDASYPNPAGYVFTPASFGLSRMSAVVFAGGLSLAAGLYEPVIVKTYTTDGTNDIASFALHLIVGTTGVEVANAVDVHTVVLEFEVYGV